MLPEFYGKFDGELIRTFKKMLFSLLKSPDDASGNEAVAVLRELWAPGGPLSTLALRTAKREDKGATDPEGFLDASTSELAERLAILFQPPRDAESATHYTPPPPLIAELDTLSSSGVLKINEEKRAKKFRDSFVHDAALVDALTAHDLWGERACQPLTALLASLRSLREEPPEWLKGWRPMHKYEHNDLNAANVLVDMRGSVWLIDFARCA